MTARNAISAAQTRTDWLASTTGISVIQRRSSRWFRGGWSTLSKPLILPNTGLVTSPGRKTDGVPRPLWFLQRVRLIDEVRPVSFSFVFLTISQIFRGREAHALGWSMVSGIGGDCH